jgi:hypothetical protein
MMPSYLRMRQARLRAHQCRPSQAPQSNVNACSLPRLVSKPGESSDVLENHLAPVLQILLGCVASARKLRHFLIRLSAFLIELST